MFCVLCFLCFFFFSAFLNVEFKVVFERFFFKKLCFDRERGVGNRSKICVVGEKFIYNQLMFITLFSI